MQPEYFKQQNAGNGVNSKMYLHFGNEDSALKEAEFAKQNVPVFQDKFQDIKFDHAMKEIPVSDKTTYRTNFPHGVLAKGLTLNSPYVQKLQSSGTSGERLVSAIHSFKLAQRMAGCIKLNPALAFFQEQSKILTCRYAAPNCSDVECSNPYTTMKDRILPDGTLVLPVYHDLLTTPKNMLETAFKELHEYPASMWYMDPMHLAFLIKKAKEYGWEFRLPDELAILFSYTMPTQALLRQIKSFFGDRYPIVNVMGMSEFGFVGLDCSHGSFHLNNENYFLEFLRINPDEEDNELWELLVTSIGDKLSPHIRYRTNDIYRILPKCSCGSDMPTVSFQGRRKDLIALENGKLVSPRDIDDLVGAPEWVDVFQLSYQKPNIFVLRFQGDRSKFVDTEFKELQQRMEHFLFSNNVHLEHVEYFPFERGGKFSLIRHEIE